MEQAKSDFNDLLKKINGGVNLMCNFDKNKKDVECFTINYDKSEAKITYEPVIDFPYKLICGDITKYTVGYTAGMVENKIKYEQGYIDGFNKAKSEESIAKNLLAGGILGTSFVTVVASLVTVMKFIDN